MHLNLFSIIASKKVHLVKLIILTFFYSLFMILGWYYFSQLAGSVFISHFNYFVNYFILFVAFLLLRGIFGYFRSETAGILAAEVKKYMRKLGIEKLLNSNPVIISGMDKGQIVTAVGDGIEAIEKYIKDYFSNMVMVALLPLLVIITVLFIDPVSALLMFVTAPIIPFVMYLVGDATKKRVEKKWREFAWMNGFFLDSIRGMQTLKVFGIGKIWSERLREVSENYRKATMGVLKVAFVSSLLLELIATVSTAVIAVEVGLRLLYSKIEFVPALFIIMLAPEFYGTFREFGSKFHSGTEGREAFSKWKTIFDITEIEKSGNIDPPEHYDIEFRDVYFTYPGSKDQVLKGVSFKIGEGEKVALAGKSGAGKSTIFRLLLKIFSPDDGNILVGGVKLKEIRSDQWLKKISVIPQNPYIFSDTLLNNILIYSPEKGKQEAIYAAEKAQIDFYNELPHGFNTVLTSGGKELSGGQRQRIAVARLLLRDSPLVLLDEFTTYLDPGTYKKMVEIMNMALANRTSLVIAHRVDTLRRADRVIFLDNGVIVAEGRHEDLIKTCKRYRELLNEKF